MKKILMTLAAMTATVAAMAQFYVYKNGEVVYRITDDVADSISTKALNYYTSDGSENGHDYVDLGLPSGTLWATVNVGANKPEGYGDYFSWGETETKDNFTWDTYKYKTEGVFTKYNSTDGKMVLDAEDDAARANWGGKWLTPTREQMNELRTECYFVKTKNYYGTGVGGYIFYKPKDEYDKGDYSYGVPKDKYKLSDVHVFLPHAGLRSSDGTYYAGEVGYYWSSSLYSSDESEAYQWDFEGVFLFSLSGFARGIGYSVRPVFKR
ncbi:MAG: hypothetical protein IJJ78_06010 [Paludibacteraceae bacterium]|nr:hypothetical protein [Paludibacteraceae bacterium]MBR0498614.1 hypothetical protein [Paludibacteraceae bacterium]